MTFKLFSKSLGPAGVLGARGELQYNSLELLGPDKGPWGGQKSNVVHSFYSLHAYVSLQLKTQN